MRQNAANWLDLADKVWAYRRDRLSAAEAGDLDGRREALRRDLRGRADAGKLKLGIEGLEGALRRAGGAIYPKSSLTENVEFFLVAAIVILGIRTYFLQPFKIPTNSMWPTYYGMTSEHPRWPQYPVVVGADPLTRPEPNLAVRLVRFLTLGAIEEKAIAPTSGEVSAEYWPNFVMAWQKVRGRKWLVFPADLREYRFYVDGQPVEIRVPIDFNGMDQIFAETYFGSEANLLQELRREIKLNRYFEDPFSEHGAFRVPMERNAVAGQPVIRFDLLTGDNLFVDRFTYHFVPPRVGQGFVFRTDLIPDIATQDYYIKRLVGVPGDVIQIHPPVLYRNGAPIAGAPAFQLNARRVAPYSGYTDVPDAKYLPPGGKVTVPPDSYFAMGDNSSDSEDSRYWGYVPAAAVIGRPLFIYYPFTKRWGLAR